MSDEKKDLTGLLQYSQAMQESGEAPPIPEGAIMEEIPIEKIDIFESLEDYAASNPPPPPPPEEAVSTSPSDPVPESDTSSGQSFDSPSQPHEESFAGSTEGAVGESISEPAENLSSPDFPEASSESSLVASSDLFAVTPQESPSGGSDDFAFSSQPSSDFNNSDAFNHSDHSSHAEGSRIAADSFSSPSDAAFDVPSNAGDFVTPASENPALDLAPPPAEPPPPTPVPAPATPKSTPLEKVKKFAEKSTPGKAVVSASFPFSLLITGKLTSEEKEKILDLLSRENMGIREIDLDPQWVSGKVLIPRISEYAGVLLIQALRGTRAQMRLGPSDSIFSTSETKDENATEYDQSENQSSTQSSDLSHPAEDLPVTSDASLPQFPHWKILDTLTASATLKAKTVEAEGTAAYQEMVEAIQREMKYKAYRRGAQGIIHFKIQLTPLSSPTHYKILAMGTTIRAIEASEHTSDSPSEQTAEQGF